MDYVLEVEKSLSMEVGSASNSNEGSSEVVPDQPSSTDDAALGETLCANPVMSTLRIHTLCLIGLYIQYLIL